ncbi:SixA phosphatase family protein [Flexibacterium corallicola]|uniref:SixA phosphatase family protein n=1 Tax=Flexibacterium corallicola TaxID=3037259 RepID=UPI00286F4C42|nr:histidine phosphatase family protein [Pseudovibrio sp. M1P-2-3]
MLRLMLLRHAKSDWADTAVHDHDRPLSGRGWSAAEAVGLHMHQHNLCPSTVLCSTALRTRQTLIEIMPYMRDNTKIHLLRDLYNSSESDYVDTICSLGAFSPTLLVVGHNTAIQETALELTGSGSPELISQMEQKYPTAGMAIIDFDARRWSEVGRAAGRLVSFFQPRTLKAVSN